MKVVKNFANKAKMILKNCIC